MDRNLLYEELLNLPELKINDVIVTEHSVEIFGESVFSESICPNCLGKTSKVNQEYKKRRVRDLDISGKPVYFNLSIKQYVCEDCSRFFHERFSFIDANSSMTKRFEKRLYKLSIGSDLTYVSIKEDICLPVVERVFYKYSKRDISDCGLFDNITALGIDEIAIKKGHKDYVCVIVNLHTAQILDVLKDRSKNYLLKYFRGLGDKFCRKIKVFTSDMWEGYVNAAKEVFPNCKIVVDRFHYFGHLQKSVDNARKYLRRKYSKAEELKNIKYLLLRNRETLSLKQKQQLDKLLACPKYKPLKEANHARNEFRKILEMNIDVETAEQLLNEWFSQNTALNNRFLNTFLKTYSNWKQYIINYFEGRWSNGIVEGINNRLKMIKRRAFGYTNFENFKTRAIIEFAGVH